MHSRFTYQTKLSSSPKLIKGCISTTQESRKIKTRHQFINTIQENRTIKIKRAQQEPPGFKFADANNQNNYIPFAKVIKDLPIVSLSQN